TSLRDVILGWLREKDKAIAEQYEKDRDASPHRFSAMRFPLESNETELLAPRELSIWRRTEKDSEDHLTVGRLAERFDALVKPRSLYVATALIDKTPPAMPVRSDPKHRFPVLNSYFLDLASPPDNEKDQALSIVLRFQVGETIAGQGIIPRYE